MIVDHSDIREIFPKMERKEDIGAEQRSDHEQWEKIFNIVSMF
jgi:hypothetical protein